MSPLLLYSLALLVLPVAIHESTSGNCVDLEPNPAVDPDGPLLVTAVTEILEREDTARLKVVIETSPDGGLSWMPVGDQTITHLGTSCVEIPVRFVLDRVRARIEVRGALRYTARVALHSAVSLAPPAPAEG